MDVAFEPTVPTDSPVSMVLVGIVIALAVFALEKIIKISKKKKDKDK